METNQQSFQFKTNINCGGCVATVKPHLDQAEDICHWEVDTKDPAKLLTVTSSGISQEEIIATVRKAGFNIESINS